MRGLGMREKVPSLEPQQREEVAHSRLDGGCSWEHLLSEEVEPARWGHPHHQGHCEYQGQTAALMAEEAKTLVPKILSFPSRSGIGWATSPLKRLDVIFKRETGKGNPEQLTTWKECSQLYKTISLQANTTMYLLSVQIYICKVIEIGLGTGTPNSERKGLGLRAGWGANLGFRTVHIIKT